MTRYVTFALAAMLTGLSVPAFAQAIPPGQSCGGLLCDMGVFGHKVAVNADGSPPTPAQVAVANREVAAAEAADPHRLPCHDFLCRAFGGKTEQEMASAAPPAPVAAAPAEPTKAARHRSKRKHVAKAEKAEAAN